MRNELATFAIAWGMTSFAFAVTIEVAGLVLIGQGILARRHQDVMRSKRLLKWGKILVFGTLVVAYIGSILFAIFFAVPSDW